MEHIKILKNNIKYCLLVHKIRQEKKKLNDIMESLMVANNTLHNGRLEVGEIIKPKINQTKKEIFKIKREIIKKGLQK